MKVQIQLASGAWRYVTRMMQNDLACSIYGSNAVFAEMLPTCKEIYPNMEFRISK